MMCKVPFIIIAAVILLFDISHGNHIEGKSQCLPYNCKTVACNVAPSIMCFTAFNVNLNETVQLANPLSYPNTTIDPSGCHLDTATQIQNVLKEKQQNPTMYKSDSKALGPIDAPLLWCDIEK